MACHISSKWCQASCIPTSAGPVVWRGHRGEVDRGYIVFSSIADAMVVSKMTDEDQTAVLKALIYDASTSQNPELFIVRMDQWVRDTSPKLFLKEE